MYPILFHLGPHLALPTFGVLAAAGLLCGLALSLRTAHRLGLNPDAVWDAGLFTVIAAFVLSRLILIVQHLRTFLQFPVLLLTVPSLTATGVLLTACAALLWLRLKRLSTLRVLDSWAPPAALVWAFLALGHFADGSDPGLAGQPVALYAAAAAFLMAAGLYALLPHRARNRPAGCIAAAGLAGCGAAQFVISFARQPGIALWGMDVLQWVAIGMIVAGGLLLSGVASASEPVRKA